MKNQTVGTMALLVVGVLFTSAALAQPGAGRGELRQRFGGGSPLDLLRNEGVRKELELLDDQVDELRAAEEEMRDEMRSWFRELRDMDANERRDAFRSKIGEMQGRLQGRLDEVLTPAQNNRFKQLQLQNSMQRRGATGAITDGPVAEALNLTEAQKERLREKAEQLNRELRVKIEKLRKEARKELLRELTGEQRRKLAELTGEDFSFTNDQQGTRRFGRGGYGQDGGGGERRRVRPDA